VTATADHVELSRFPQYLSTFGDTTRPLCGPTAQQIRMQAGQAASRRPVIAGSIPGQSKWDLLLDKVAQRRLLSALAVSVHQCSILAVSVHQCSILAVSVHQCSILAVSVHQCSILAVSVHQCSILIRLCNADDVRR